MFPDSLRQKDVPSSVPAYQLTIVFHSYQKNTCDPLTQLLACFTLLLLTQIFFNLFMYTVPFSLVAEMPAWHYCLLRSTCPIFFIKTISFLFILTIVVTFD